MTGGVDPSHQLVLFHTMDPRGRKLGGIETHVRLVLANHPASSSLLFVGIDELGDLTPGRIVPVTIGDRSIEFLPVAGVPTAAINRAAKRLGQSTTLRYALGLIRHFGALRRAVAGRPASSEVERFEIALVPKLLGLPLVLLVHNEGTRKDAMDTLLKKYWVLHRLNERIALEVADRVFAVNPSIAARIAHLSKRLGDKTEVMSVSVDTRRFKPIPFAAHDDAFHVCFAGRLDAFKDPDLMFATLACLAQRLAARTTGRFRRLVFDYVGASDPDAFATFAGISGLCVRHGILPPAEVARVMGAAHAGLITSFFEGMPCYLLEMIASGRPVVAVALPQFVPVVVPGVSGALVERAADPAASANRLATRLLEIAESIDAGGLDPATIARLAGPFSVDTQLRRLFDRHRALAIGEAEASAATASASSA